MNNNRGFKRNNGPDRRYKKSREEIEMEEQKFNDEHLPDESEIDTNNYTHIDPNAKTTVFIGQLPFDTTEQELLDYLKKYDIEVKNIRMLEDKNTKKFRGMCFIDVPAGTVHKALRLHHSYFKNRCINVEETIDGGKHSESSTIFEETKGNS